MADPYKSVFFELPLNNEVVWIRVLNQFSEPFLATFKFAQNTFEGVDTGIIVEAWYVARWKSQ